MRNFDKPLALIATAMAMYGAPEAAQANAADAHEHFRQCARIALASDYQREPVSAISAVPASGPVSQKNENGVFVFSELAFVDFQAEQVNPIRAKDGSPCTGLAGLKAVLILRAGSLAQKVRGSVLNIHYPNGPGRPRRRTQDGKSMFFAYDKLCREANDRPGYDRPYLDLIDREQRSYTEGGSTVRRTSTSLVRWLPCRQAGQTG